LAAARAKPYNRTIVGPTDMSAERFRQIAELYHAAREALPVSAQPCWSRLTLHYAAKWSPSWRNPTAANSQIGP